MIAHCVYTLCTDKIRGVNVSVSLLLLCVWKLWLPLFQWLIKNIIGYWMLYPPPDCSEEHKDLLLSLVMYSFVNLHMPLLSSTAQQVVV